MTAGAAGDPPRRTRWAVLAATGRGNERKVNHLVFGGTPQRARRNATGFAALSPLAGKYLFAVTVRGDG